MFCHLLKQRRQPKEIPRKEVFCDRSALFCAQVRSARNKQKRRRQFSTLSVRRACLLNRDPPLAISCDGRRNGRNGLFGNRGGGRERAPLNHFFKKNLERECKRSVPDLNLQDPSSACNGGIHPVLSGPEPESGIHSERAVFTSEVTNPVDKVAVRGKPDFSEKDEQHLSVSHFGERESGDRVNRR